MEGTVWTPDQGHILDLLSRVTAALNELSINTALFQEVPAALGGGFGSVQVPKLAFLDDVWSSRVK